MFQISRVLLALCAVVAIVISLAIIAVACFRLDQNGTRLLIEGMLIALVTLWASVPLATSGEGLLFKIAYHATLFFAVLYFTAAQTIIAFWITLVVLTGIIIVEHWRRLDTDPIYTRIAQTITVLMLTATVLRHCTQLFLPTLQAALNDQYTWLMNVLRLREGIIIFLGAIIVFATGVNTIHRLRGLTWREYRAPISTNPMVVALFDLRYYVSNGWRFFSLIFVTILREAIVYVVNTLFNPNLLKTILYSAATAAIGTLLVAQVFYVRPYLLTVLRSADPFFLPSPDLLYAYTITATALTLTITALVLLTWIALPRAATRIERQPAWQRFTITTAAAGVCIWLSTTVAWITNSLFHLDGKQFLTPGYFSAIVVPFALWAGIQAARSGLLWNTTSDDK